MCTIYTTQTHTDRLASTVYVTNDYTYVGTHIRFFSRLFLYMSETSDEILDMKMHEIQKLVTKHLLELFQASLCRHLPA